MRGKERSSIPALALMTALAPPVLIILALIVAMVATDGAEMTIALGIAAMLTAFYLLRWRLLRRLARRDSAAAVHRAEAREVTKPVDSSWPINRPRSHIAVDARERVS